MARLEGKIALITGASRGIGLGITRRFLEEGAVVVAAQRGAPPADLLEHGGDRLHCLQADLSDSAVPARIVGQAAARFGGLDILVNNAGIGFEKSVTETNLDDWSALIAVNLTAPFLSARAAVPHMIARGGGAIVNLGSIEGLGANPRHTAYATSKAGVHGMTKALAVDLGPQGIRCNAIAPGCIETDMVTEWMQGLPDRDAFTTEFLAMHPLGRFGQPEDIGNLAVFLASPEAGFLTGQIFIADGGRMAKLSAPQGI